MASPPHESSTLSSYLGIDVEVDYGSDTDVHGEERTMSDSPVQEASPHTAPNPFAERGEATAPSAQHQTLIVGDAIITNPLDEQQQLAIQREESAQRRMQLAATLEGRRGYLFTPLNVEERIRQTTGRSLATWAIGAEPTSSDEVASRQALRERYLQPHLTTQSQYKLRLDTQARGAPVPPMKGIPILLFAGESQEEEDNAFVRWVHRKRHLSSVLALRASADVADVRLERKLRYDYAKLKARGQLRTRTRYAPAVPIDVGVGQAVPNYPPASTTIGVAPHGTGGSLAHRAASEVVGIPKEEHEKVLLELSGLRETLGKTQSAFDAMRARVQALELGQARMEAQLDLLIRIQQPMARPTYAAQAPPSSRGTDPDTA
ncbi:unnamed protein product [Peronospora destructor]|uniref:Uncharacterized protein n=1 Tax=Peronospora destructor TaxID=86335 RepID=A0AAV0U9U2_9STRA|nr:unnamed protein product [Peronospora destructor]